MFYSTEEDTQRDYVEYVMKKATGSDIKELASILIPILERMPEDKWNFEAVLLYDKLDRKDKALEESRYILENFKESVYVQPVIDYIDDKLDVDEHFFIYPQQEIPEDEDLFGDLIVVEDQVLEQDYLRMHPPEARIMVEAEDEEGNDAKPVKEKKSKRKIVKKGIDFFRKNAEKDEDTEKTVSEAEENQEIESQPEQEKIQEQDNTENNTVENVQNESVSENITEEGGTEEKKETKISEEDQIKQEREEALEKLLSKKFNTEQIKESAKQMAKAVKDINAGKVKTVTHSVKDNVKKATDAIGEAVGAKAVVEEDSNNENAQNKNVSDAQIVDGIIESVLEPPKKVVGEVVVNEELDALIPDSLEAMSEEEIADIEMKKEEAERLELEALEAQFKLEEEKKQAKNKSGKSVKDAEDETAKEQSAEEVLSEKENVSEKDTKDNLDAGAKKVGFENTEFERLKAEFLEEMNGQQPLDSLGYFSEHQEKEEKASKQREEAGKTGGDKDEGFEVVDYDFEIYRENQPVEFYKEEQKTDSKLVNEVEEISLVETIYAQKDIIDFDEIVPEQVNTLDFREVIPEDVVTVIDVSEQYFSGVIDEGDLFQETVVEVDQGYTDIILKQDNAKEKENPREMLRLKIMLSDDMVRKLLYLKESR